MDEYLAQCKNIEVEIAKLNEYIYKMRYYSKRKSNSVMNDQEEKKIDTRIQILTDFFKNTTKKVKAELKDIQNDNEKLSSERDEFEYTSRINRWEVLTKNLSDVVDAYRSSQLDHSKEEKERLKSQFRIAKPEATDEELHELVHLNPYIIEVSPPPKPTAITGFNIEP